MGPDALRGEEDLRCRRPAAEGWAISCIQRDTASVAAVARRLGVDWHTLWSAIKPLLTELANDPDGLHGVEGAMIRTCGWPSAR